MGHLHNDALLNLKEKVDGVQLTGSMLHICQVRHTANARQQVSQHPATHATVPFGCVHLDLILMTTGYNSHQWILHIPDDFTRMNFTYTLFSKSQLMQTIKDFAAFVQQQYSQQIRKLKTDGERSLGKVFDTWVARAGIAVEVSALYTLAQNGTAERFWGVIVAKARALCIDAQLPEEM
jgi:transposase InsO family protein